ncbi:MAG TPA: hypothetical protein VK579_12375 [Terriglobales bacterium]|nr:hypothetical protein [Terriglobales bacterium]
MSNCCPEVLGRRYFVILALVPGIKRSDALEKLPAEIMRGFGANLIHIQKGEHPVEPGRGSLINLMQSEVLDDELKGALFSTR